MVYVIGLALLGPIVFLILPVVLGALASELGLGEGQLGLLAMTELLGIAITASSGMYWVNRWHWRTVVAAALVIIIVGNLATWQLLGEISYSGLVSLRTLIGLAAGMLMAIMYSYLAAHPQTERAAGYLFASQTALQVAGVYLVPAIITAAVLGGVFFGASGIFLCFAILAGALLVAVSALPSGAGTAESVEVGHADDAPKVRALVVLVSFLLFFVGQTSVWGFLELFGAEAGLANDDTILAITLSTAAAIFGPLFASVFGSRFGQFMPIAAAGALQFTGLALLLFVRVDFGVLLVALSLFQVGWTMALPFHLGVLTDVDPTHRFIVLTSPFSAVGVALGPAYGGVIIESFGYGELFVASGVVLAAYLACILPFAKRR